MHITHTKAGALQTFVTYNIFSNNIYARVRENIVLANNFNVQIMSIFRHAYLDTEK